MKPKRYYLNGVWGICLVSAVFLTGISNADAQSRIPRVNQQRAQRTDNRPAQRLNQIARQRQNRGTMDRNRPVADGFSEIRFRGNVRYFRNGLFYSRSNGILRLSGIERGVVVDRLPRRSRAVRVGGKKYHWYSGVYYRPVRKGFRVVAPPLKFRQRHLWLDLPLPGFTGLHFRTGASYAWSPAHKQYRPVNRYRSGARTFRTGAKRLGEYDVAPVTPRGSTLGRYN